MVAVDVAVVGGGLQGLVLLRELNAAGYGTVLITKADLGGSQTLHSHGLLSSGTGLLTGGLQRELHDFTLPYLRSLGVPVYGDDRSYLIAPDSLVEQLGPVWEANQYHPEPVDPSSLPPGFESMAPVYRVRGFNVDTRRLVAALSAGVEDRILRGDLLEAGQALLVRSQATSEVVSVEARAVVVAAGCGTKQLLRGLFGLGTAVVDLITYTKVHMICLRGPGRALADVGTVIAPELIVVGHPAPDASASPSDHRVTWYVTPVNPSRPVEVEAPDDAAAAVEAGTVAQALEALVRLVPRLSQTDEPIEATVFAGYKQDFDGQPTKRACEVVDEQRNVLMVLPSVLANAVPNAVEACTLIRELMEPSPAGTAAALTSGGESPATVAERTEDALQWTNWRGFAHRYGVSMG